MVMLEDVSAEDIGFNIHEIILYLSGAVDGNTRYQSAGKAAAVAAAYGAAERLSLGLAFRVRLTPVLRGAVGFAPTIGAAA